MSASTELGSARPFLRWAGSKRWLVPHIARYLPSRFGNYYEPFLGSGAVFFSLHSSVRDHFLSDRLRQLVNCYEQLARDPHNLRNLIDSFGTTADEYYAIREQQSVGDSVMAAAQFIYFNRLGFNGLYRVNLQGRFNVPYGRARSSMVFTEVDDLAACARVLRDRVVVRNLDFEDALAGVSEGDLVYLDPPYVAGHRHNGFVDYNAKVFQWSDQERLARVVAQLSDLGALILMSNADHPTIRELYAGSTVIELSRFSSMAGRPSAREHSSELLILNRPLKERLKWPV